MFHTEYYYRWHCCFPEHQGSSRSLRCPRLWAQSLLCRTSNYYYYCYYYCYYYYCYYCSLCTACAGTTCHLPASRSYWWQEVLSYMSKTFLSNLAIPRSPVFCKVSTVVLISNLARSPFTFFVTEPKPPVMVGMISTLSTSPCQHFKISYLRSVYLLIFIIIIIKTHTPPN